ncbi:MAG: wax ester/triacylglycerol synthase family O-acyltransferase [Steroidobacteraceae bacterium]|jgi:WS/DGAT/MGAT family acyltransferase|nr:wax ester/triacylglycerol synthase family O-acyltransferase [Steroidobacteraceae bacterium]
MGERLEPMSGVDTAWLHMDRPANPMQILGVLALDRRVRLEALRRRIAARFLRHARFLARPVEAAIGAAWERDETFDLDAHVREQVLPPRAGEAGLRRLLDRLASTPLDPARPRWEFVLVQVSPRRSVLVARLHHCYADGVALARLVLGLADGAARGDPPRGAAGDPRDEDDDPGPLADLASTLLTSAWRESGALLERGLRLASQPAEAAKAAAAGLGMAAELAQLALQPDEPASALRGALSGTKRVAWAEPLPFTLVRATARALGCTINDLLVAAATGALAAWLRARRGAPAGAPQLRAIVPVNLRSSGDDEALGNRFGLGLLTLPVGEPSARARLAAVRQRMQALKASRQPAATLALLAALGLAPRALQSGVVDLLSRKATLVLSNVPGPREPLRLLGAAVDSTMFWVPQSGELGLGLSLLTCGGRVLFGVMADTALVPDPARIAARFPQELRRYARLAGVASLSRRAAPRARR